MAIHLKDLLKGAVGRARITRQVGAAQVVERTTEVIRRLLPTNRHSDARVISFKDGVVRIEASNGAASQVIRRHEEQIIKELSSLLPDVKIEKIRTRIHRPRPFDL